MSVKIRTAIALAVLLALASLVAVGNAGAKDGKPIYKPIKLQEHSSYELH